MKLGLVTGCWFVRNAGLYGDQTAQSVLTRCH